MGRQVWGMRRLEDMNACSVLVCRLQVPIAYAALANWHGLHHA